MRGPDGVESRLHLEVVFVDDISTSDIQVVALPGDGRAFLDTWYVEGDPTTHAHEVTHGAFGIKDEYVDPSVPDRADKNGAGVHNDQSIMGDYWVDDPARGKVADPRATVKQRHVDEIGKKVPKAPSKPATRAPADDRATRTPEPARGPSEVPSQSPSSQKSPEAPPAPAPAEGLQSRAQFAQERNERTKAVESNVSPDKAAIVHDVEALALDSEWEFEAGQRVGDPLFGGAASTALTKAAGAHQHDAAATSGIKQIGDLSKRLQRKMLDILRNPDLDVATRRRELLAVIGDFEHAIKAGQSLFPSDVDVAGAFRFAEARAAASVSIDDTFDKKLLMDERGDVHKGRTRIGSFRELIDKVIATNQAFIEVGDPHELVIVDSAVGNGKHEILVMSREVKPAGKDRGGNALPVQAHPDPNAVIIDIGSGLSSFALDLLQPADRQNGPVVQTEHGPSIVDGSRTRRDLGWKSSVPRSDAASVIVFGDPMANLDTLFGEGGVKRVFINNVNANYSPAQYKQLGKKLARAMASNGRVEVQWTNAPEFDGGEAGTRGHIDGYALLGVLEAEAAATGRQVTASEAGPDTSPDQSYGYSVKPSTRVDGVKPGKAVPTDPVPTQKVVIIFGERRDGGAKE